MCIRWQTSWVLFWVFYERLDLTSVSWSNTFHQQDPLYNTFLLDDSWGFGIFHFDQLFADIFRSQFIKTLYLSESMEVSFVCWNRQKTPSLGKKIQHSCLIYLDNEQPSCFSCLKILGCNYKIIGILYHIFDQAMKRVLNFTLFSNIMGFEFGAWSIFSQSNYVKHYILPHLLRLQKIRTL